MAFSGLRGEELYPIVSAVWGHCEVRDIDFSEIFFTTFFSIFSQVTLTYIGNHFFDGDRSEG